MEPLARIGDFLAALSMAAQQQRNYGKTTKTMGRQYRRSDMSWSNHHLCMNNPMNSYHLKNLSRIEEVMASMAGLSLEDEDLTNAFT